MFKVEVGQSLEPAALKPTWHAKTNNIKRQSLKFALICAAKPRKMKLKFSNYGHAQPIKTVEMNTVVFFRIDFKKL